MSRERKPAAPRPANLVVDLDGVVYHGSVGVAGAGEALRAAERLGCHLIFATNASMRQASDVAAAIDELTGYQARPEQVVTSSQAAAGMLSPSDLPVLVIGEAGLLATLQASGVSFTREPASAASVVVGLDRELRYSDLHRACRAIMGGARFIATNTDPTYPMPDGFWPGCGAIVAAVEAVTSRRAEVAGKPHPPMRAAIRARLLPGDTWVVGDRPDTDLAMARAEGWTGVLVLTGVTAASAQVPAELTPTIEIPTIADLPGLLA